jgi:hypothetical protein
MFAKATLLLRPGTHSARSEAGARAQLPHRTLKKASSYGERAHESDTAVMLGRMQLSVLSVFSATLFRNIPRPLRSEPLTPAPQA